MSSSTTNVSTPLSEDVLAVMDRAVRASREEGWCGEFSRVASKVFLVPINEVVDNEGFNCRGYNAAGFNTDGFNEDGYNTEGFDYNGRDRDGYDKEGFDRRGVNKEGVDRQGRDKYRFDRDGFDQEGYDSDGNRRRGTRMWYEAQVLKPETDFVYDHYGYQRPAEPAPAEPKKRRFF